MAGLKFAWLAAVGGLAAWMSLFSFEGVAYAATVTLLAAQDNTILNDSFGDVGGGQGKSNGQGPLFVGTLNRSPFHRRALVWFDVVAEIPAGAIVESAELRLQMTAVGPNPDSIAINLHLLLGDWGEGASYAVGGTGADAQPGDATWQYTFFNTASWTTPGGDFVAAASGSAIVDDTQGTKIWSSMSTMVTDVQMWVDDQLLERPPTNFGWLLQGPESDLGTARRFDSGEPLEGAARANVFPQIEVPYLAPQLIVQYTVVPEPRTISPAILGLIVFAPLARRLAKSVGSAGYFLGGERDRKCEVA